MFGPQSITSLLNGSEDVLVIDTNAGSSAAHVSSLMRSAKRDGCIYVAGVRSPEHKSEIQSKLDILGAASKWHQVLQSWSGSINHVMTTVVKFLLFAIFMRLFMEKTFYEKNERDTNEVIKKSVGCKCYQKGFFKQQLGKDVQDKWRLIYIARYILCKAILWSCRRPTL